MTTARYFCLAVYGFKKCCPVHLDPYTKNNAERAKRWQMVADQGGQDNFHIVTVHPTERGTFVSVETGAHFEASQMAYTKEAWDRFLDRMWPPA
ncbi:MULTISPECIES: hypothetical protein [unclassified Mesorhizobium]|uniref:hypothetical protein n=1 Tax=unclassified Mesorhizobium TaxID=325217 RepID=UPI0011298306|nr:MULTISPECIES: hypothetical protein [unclassified Mesorhizobium]TPJ51765.1 hypothetical protein FJ426_18850 [Mesorhizobium sp. B2-6-4]TPN42387.1 hypothetical protein FJ979_02265 [Mesorhizobium sp. B1-1-6]